MELAHFQAVRVGDCAHFLIRIVPIGIEVMVPPLETVEMHKLCIALAALRRHQ